MQDVPAGGISPGSNVSDHQEHMGSVIDPRVKDLFGTWKSDGAMDAVIATAIDQQLDVLLEAELARVEALLDVAPGAAFARLVSLISFLNGGASHRPAIVGRLEKWIPRLRDIMRKLAVGLEASSFNISAGSPNGLSVGLSFPVTRRSSAFYP